MKDKNTKNNENLLDLLLMPVEAELNDEAKLEREKNLKKKLQEIMLELDALREE